MMAQPAFVPLTQPIPETQQGWPTPPRPDLHYAQGYGEGTNYANSGPTAATMAALGSGMGYGATGKAMHFIDALAHVGDRNAGGFSGTLQHDDGITQSYQDHAPVTYGTGVGLGLVGAIKAALELGRGVNSYVGVSPSVMPNWTTPPVWGTLAAQRLFGIGDPIPQNRKQDAQQQQHPNDPSAALARIYSKR
jgi:hypothetical protein